ncbi:MAG: hypothetical protein JW940_36610 [Polyangiaceae bacterium]|nr:hypothetical protein [Polyangiaceae bacterium]
MPISASRLRSDIYRILDEVVRTGVPVQIERGGHVLEIVAKDAPNKLKRLVRRPFLKGPPEAIVHLDWSGEWKP